MNFSAWRATNDGKLLSAIDDETRADGMLWLINRDPESLSIKRGSSTLAAQTVRVVIKNSRDGEQAGMSEAVSGLRGAVVYGIRNHATLADTNIQIGDVFSLHSQVHRVINVINVPGGIEAHTEVIA